MVYNGQSMGGGGAEFGHLYLYTGMKILQDTSLLIVVVWQYRKKSFHIATLQDNH